MNENIMEEKRMFKWVESGFFLHFWKWAADRNQNLGDV